MFREWCKGTATFGSSAADRLNFLNDEDAVVYTNGSVHRGDRSRLGSQPESELRLLMNSVERIDRYTTSNIKIDVAAITAVFIVFNDRISADSTYSRTLQKS